MELRVCLSNYIKTSLITVLLVACTVQPVPLPVAQAVVYTIEPQGIATRTPFQPQSPLASPTKPKKPKKKQPTPTPTPIKKKKPKSTLTATPSSASGTPALPVSSSAELPEGQITVLFLGSDQRLQDPSFRTDVIMLVAIRPRQGTASVLSFPRDLYVQIPGWGSNRINTVQQLGGFRLLADTLDFNFGIRPEHYIMINFRGFIDLIDRLEGIDVNVAANLTDQCDLPQADWNGTCSVGPGSVHMDGATALWYVRSRHTTNDFDRTHRQQEVLYAIFNRLLSLDAVHRAPELYRLYRQNVETDLSLEDILPLAQVMPQLTQPKRIRQFFIGPTETWSYISLDGAWVQLPNQAAIQTIIQEAFFNP